MNIEKADYGTIVKFGTLKDLHEKIKIKNVFQKKIKLTIKKP